MKKRFVVLILFSLILLILSSTPLVLGATIHGRVFDYNFRLVKNSVVRINTVPEQVVVSTDGAYSFSVPQGDYVITAELNDEFDIVRFSIQDNISIIDDGDYVRDLILFPQEDLDELDLEEDLEQALEEQEEEKKEEVPVHIRIIISGILIIILGFIVWLALRGKERSRVFLASCEGDEEPDDLASLLGFIKKHRRVTQKEIRREFAFSEAKISLMLADLESQGKIRKIKKGRGNIIIYNQKHKH